MAAVKYYGTGQVLTADFKAVKWVGKTKNGKACTIELSNAINMGNINWTFAEKDDVVPQIVFSAAYTNTDAHISDTTEPWSIIIEDGVTAGAAEILLGAGLFYIGGTAVALTRGGGSFDVARTFREINADDDMGPVKDRVVITESRATLTMNILTMLTNVSGYYPAVATTTATT